MNAVCASPFSGQGRAMLAGLALGVAVVAGLLTAFPIVVRTADNTMPLVSACDFARGECQQTLPDGTEVGLRLNPARPAALRPFQVEVRVFGGKPVRVEYAVRNADGGLDQSRLERVGPGRWQGKGMLSWCGTADMAATVLVTSLGKERRVPFAFDMESSR
jgi:hypothetical protein